MDQEARSGIEAALLFCSPSHGALSRLSSRPCASRRLDGGQVGGTLLGDDEWAACPDGCLCEHSVRARDAGACCPLAVSLERNDGYRATVVGSAADCCAVGGRSVDGKLLISFWWRTFRGRSLGVTRGRLRLFACLFFFFSRLNNCVVVCHTRAERFKEVLSYSSLPLVPDHLSALPGLASADGPTPSAGTTLPSQPV